MKTTSKRNPEVSRRSFLKSSAAFGAFTILPSSMLFGQSKPSDKVNLAVIGIGNRGRQNIGNIIQGGLCNIVALCDIDLQGKHTQEIQAQFPKARKFTDFRELFDKAADDFDAILICTPDHAHFTMAMLAMEHGKHLYVEKPLAHTFGQIERLMDKAQRSGVVTQMGNQGHSGGNYFQFKAWTEAGFIKDVTRITAYMNKKRRWHGWGESVAAYPNQPIPAGVDWDLWANSAPVNNFSDKLHPQEWRSWYDYGSGAFGDWGPHMLDTCHRFLKLGFPTEVEAIKREGPNDFVFPQASTISFKFPERHGMPACDVTWYDGQENLPEIDRQYGKLEKDPATGKETRAPVDIGSPGKILYSKDHVFQGGAHEAILRILPYDKYMDMRRELPRYSQKNSNHYDNFLLACKGEEESRSPFSVSGPLSQVFTLGCIGQRLGGTLKFDSKTKSFTNSKAANALLDPAPRQGWEQYYTL